DDGVDDDDDEAPSSSPIARVPLVRPTPAPDGVITEVVSRRSIRAPSSRAPRARVLLVGRDAVVRAALGRDLVGAGCDLHAVAPGDLGTCKDSVFDVVVLDAPEREVRAAVATILRVFP